ncbi:MAG: hypothetical protein LBJ11_06070 [Oscillospiraceae bacterium]|jgi:hypothetical protein|nr:hypothetical protein [Oscillospiraceae bacterium]
MKRGLALSLCLLLFAAVGFGCAGQPAGDPASAVSTKADDVSAADPAAVGESAAAAVVARASESTVPTTAAPTLTAFAPAAETTPLARAATTAAAAAPKTTKTTVPKPTQAPVSGKTKWEVDASSVQTKAAGATVLRAWKASRGTVSVEAHRLSYGAKRVTSGTSGSANRATVQPIITVAVVTASPESVHAATAAQVFPELGCATVEDLAQAKGALVAVGLSYSNQHESAFPVYTVQMPVVREGKVVATGSQSWPVLNVYRNGDWKYEDVNSGTVAKQLGAGLQFNIVDQMVPVKNGKVDFVYHDAGDEPFVFVGQIDKTHYLLGVGEFMSRDNMIQVLLAYGAKTLAEINGGNCAYLYLAGVGNALNPNTKAPQLLNSNTNKLNLMDNESQYLLGIFGGKGMGGKDKTIDFLYFK